MKSCTAAPQRRTSQQPCVGDTEAYKMSSAKNREQWAPCTLGHLLHTWVCKTCSHLGNCLAVTWEITHIFFMTQQFHSQQKHTGTEDTQKDGHRQAQGQSQQHLHVSQAGNSPDAHQHCWADRRACVSSGTAHGGEREKPWPYTASHSLVVGGCVILSASSSKAGRQQDGSSLAAGGQIWGTSGPALTWMGAAWHRTHQV